MKRFRLVTIAAMLAILAGASGLLRPPVASAHEHRTVAGTYTFVVGWLNEPAYVEQSNGVSLVVTNAQSNQPVNGLEKTLKVEVSVGGASKTFDLQTVFNKDGAYQAQFIPTKTGTWDFHFTGTVEGTPIDEKFESGPNRFDDVTSRAGAEFPVAVPSNGELAAQIQSLHGSGAAPTATAAPASAPAQPAPTPAAAAEAAAGASNASGQAQSRADSAESRANTAIAIGIIGLLFGLVGAGLGIYGLSAARRSSMRAGGPPSGEPI